MSASHFNTIMKATIKDAQGNLIAEFDVVSCSISSNYSSPYVRDVKVEGIQHLPPDQGIQQYIGFPYPDPVPGIDGSDFDIQDPGPPPEMKAPCNHDWASYQGLVESYKFCKACGVKQ